MTWPPAGLPIDFENATPQENTHPDAHNATNQTINDDIVPEINRVGALAETIGLYLPLTGGTLTGDIQVDGQTKSTSGGSKDTPAFQIGPDKALGMFGSIASQWIRFTTDGEYRFQIGNEKATAYGDLQVDGQTKVANGTKAAPAYSFTTDSNTGMFLQVNGGRSVVSLAAESTTVMNIGTAGVSFPGLHDKTIASPANVFVAADGQLFRSTVTRTPDVDTADLTRLESVIETLTARIEQLEARLETDTTDV